MRPAHPPRAPDGGRDPEPMLPGWALWLQSLPHAAWLVALVDRRVLAANGAAAELLQRPHASLSGIDALDIAAAPEDAGWWSSAELGLGTASLHSDSVFKAAAGAWRHTKRSISLLRSGSDGCTAAALVLHVDCSGEQAPGQAGERLLAELGATLEATGDGILVTDAQGVPQRFNRRFAEIWQLPAALAQGSDGGAIRRWMIDSVGAAPGATPDSAGAAFELQLAALQRMPLCSIRARLRLTSERVLDVVTRPLLVAGLAEGQVFSCRDLSERMRAEDRVQQLTLHDALTGLPSRARLSPAIDAASLRLRQHGPGFALLVIDLDRFRHINDSLGQETGDRVLCAVAERIRQGLRREDLLVRLGSDQFAVLVASCDQAAAEATARRVLNVVARPCSVDGAGFTLTCSIGMALAPLHGERQDDLLRHAEAAMRAAKAGGRASWRLHAVRADLDRRQHLRLDHAMRQALVSGRLRLHYQPQLDLNTGSVVGAEALLRWRDPELGEIAPATFIPVAEDSGFIIALGDWVLSQAVRQAALWHGRGQALTVAVNVSALQFQQAAFVDRVASVLAVSGLPPQLLELELTESILVNDAEEALHRLHALSRLGVQLSIDDFGTGYSSLSYLKRFPIGKLKIDRSFITDLPGDDSDAGIVRAILQMARALGKRVIAEGVETEAQRHFLHDAGCDEAQGWLFAPALDSLSFEARRVALTAAAAVPLPQVDRSVGRRRQSTSD